MNNSAKFVRIATCSPRVWLGDVEKNTEEILSLITNISDKKADIIVFPELCLTGASLGDLLAHSSIINACQYSINKILKFCEQLNSVIVIGLPYYSHGALYNCAFIFQGGKVLGVVPKTYLGNSLAKNDARLFSSVCNAQSIDINGETYPFSNKLVFKCKAFSFSVVIGDGKATKADIVLNIDSSIALANSNNNIKAKLAYKSQNCIYAYVNAGFGESTSTAVYDGYQAMFECGTMLIESPRFQTTESFIIYDCDFEKVHFKNIKSNKNYNPTTIVNFNQNLTINLPLYRSINPSPFLPKVGEEKAMYDEIIAIQTTALASRLKHIGTNTVLLGVSGGLDSSYALLIAAKTFDILGLDKGNIIGISMPGFGTSNRTSNNADILMDSLGISKKNIDIQNSVKLHFNDIGHDINKHDVCFENAQARERTQILMDLANIYNGIVLGTGDMSEAALGFCTFNGDHMSMYNVNASIPKTLMRKLILHLANSFSNNIKNICVDIVGTPVSPELLPMQNGELTQKTEDILGSYDIHDFLLYNLLDSGASREKLTMLAKLAFKNSYSESEIERTIDIFLKRFFVNQFKRNCSPDSPMVTNICLSPFGGLIMPSDIKQKLWQNNK